MVNIYVPAVVALTKEEIGLFFSDAEDPKLNDLTKIQEFSDYISNKFKLHKKKVTYINRMIVRKLMVYLENPEMAMKGIEFVLGHEIGHYKLKHLEKRTWTEFIVNTATLGIFPMIKSQFEELEADRFSAENFQAEGAIYLYEIIERNENNAPWIDRINLQFFNQMISLTHTSFRNRINQLKNVR